MAGLQCFRRFAAVNNVLFRSNNWFTSPKKCIHLQCGLNSHQDEKRQRVEQIVKSPAFLESLGTVVEHQIANGDHAGLLALQQILTKSHGTEEPHGFDGKIAKPVIPIDDIGSTNSQGYSVEEKNLRCKLSSLYRLVDHYGWSQSIYNHITVRVSKDEEHFLLNPFGLLYHEITASSLIKVDLQGQLIDAGSTNFDVNYAGFILHSAVHSARPDAKCVLHIHHPACVAVSAMKCGFLPVSQESVALGDVSYHDFQGILVDAGEREDIVKNLGPVNKQMILRNHGIVVVEESVEAAFFRMFFLVLACESQVRMMSAGLENLIIISEEAKQRSMEVVRMAQEFMNARANMQRTKEGIEPSAPTSMGFIEFEAHMRMLDSAGYRTGYPYSMTSITRK